MQQEAISGITNGFFACSLYVYRFFDAGKTTGIIPEAMPQQIGHCPLVKGGPSIVEGDGGVEEIARVYGGTGKIVANGF